MTMHKYFVGSILIWVVVMIQSAYYWSTNPDASGLYAAAMMVSIAFVLWQGYNYWQYRRVVEALRIIKATRDMVMDLVSRDRTVEWIPYQATLVQVCDAIRNERLTIGVVVLLDSTLYIKVDGDMLHVQTAFKADIRHIRDIGQTLMSFNGYTIQQLVDGSNQSIMEIPSTILDVMSMIIHFSSDTTIQFSPVRSGHTSQSGPDMTAGLYDILVAREARTQTRTDRKLTRIIGAIEKLHGDLLKIGSTQAGDAIDEGVRHQSSVVAHLLDEILRQKD